MIKPVFLFSVFSMCWSVLMGQSLELITLHPEKTHYIQSGDSLIIQSDKTDTLVYVTYKLKPKNTLYGLSKIFQTTVRTILAANPKLNTKTLTIGDSVRVPLHPARITSVANGDNDPIRLYYRVERGQTLYSIAKKKLKRSIMDLVNKNHLSGNHLQPDQVLFVGYFAQPPSLSNDTTHQVTDTSGSESFHESDRLSKFAKAYLHETIYDQKGMALWRKSKTKGLFVLHPEARIGSIIQVTNPMFGITRYAKVIGRIPAKAYTDQIKVIVSMQLAHELGALDPKFFVRLRYIK